MSTPASESNQRPVRADALEAGLAWLVERAGYDPAWLRARARRVGESLLSVTTPGGAPYLWIASAPGDLDEAEARLRHGLEQCETAGLGLATDGTDVRLFRRHFARDRIEPTERIEAFARPAATRPRETRPLGAESARLFFEISSIARDEDGLHADAALDELCKLLRAKLHAETTRDTPRDAFDPARYASTEEHAAELRALVTRAARASALDPAETLRLSSTALALCAGRMAPFTLRDASVDAIGRAFESVLVPAIRSGMGQYFTPDPIVGFMVRALDPRAGETIVDPFCGSGRFLYACHRHLREAAGSPPELFGVEKSPRMARLLAADMALREWAIDLRCGDALLDDSRSALLASGPFDVVVTNPPFGSSLRTDTSEPLGRFALAAGRRSTPLEWLALERSIDLLRPGGRIGIVLPYGIVANAATRAVRDWLTDRVKLRALVSLPPQAFAPHGAAVRTVLVFARKREAGEQTQPRDRAWLAHIDALGYDNAGNPEPGGELTRASSALRAFLDAEGF